MNGASNNKHKNNNNNKKRKVVPLVPAKVSIPKQPQPEKASNKEGNKHTNVAAEGPKPKKPKQTETVAPTEHAANEGGAPVTLQFVECALAEKATVHTKTLKYTNVHKQMDGHAILNSSTFDSDKKAQKFLNWFLAPLPAKEFLDNFWEKKALVLKRKHATRADGSNYYDGWWSKDMINTLMEHGALKYSTDMDVTLYKDGKRHTLNPQGGNAADPDLVWQLYDKVGCSVRILRPQQYSPKVASMLALLEEAIGQGWGSNSYLTPSKSQGFAPHWDDVEAFVMQLEGRKLWKIHAPRDPNELLARTSSPNFSQIEVGEPIMQVWLEPGDLMYFPRGTIHQASSASDEHSLHLTVSTGQNNSWADFFERAVPNALNAAINDSAEFRASLPIKYGDYMGVMYSDLENDPRREAFLKKATDMMEKVFNEYVVGEFDDAADLMMCKFLHDRQPPQALLSCKELGVPASEMEKLQYEDGRPLETSGSGNLDDDSDDEEQPEHDVEMPDDDEPAQGGDDDDDTPITVDTKVKLASKHAVRIVTEGETVALYHASANSSIYHAVEPQKLTFPLEVAAVVEELCRAYPEYVAVKDFPLDEEDDKVYIAESLVNAQILMVE